MSPLQRVRKTLGVMVLAIALPAFVSGQTTNYYATQGSEYFPAGSLPGDQINPCVAISTSGGYLVWQDNITDGDGFGISAVQMDSTFSPIFGNFRVNVQGANDQENPQVALLNGGGAAFVWQGGKQGFQHIYARFLSASNLWVTGDVMVNTDTNHYQVNPCIATLTNGNVVVVWASVGQDNVDGFQGVYAQIFTPTGQKVGVEFLINQFTPYNQRTPAIAAFGNGNFIVAWVSEMERLNVAIPVSGLQISPTNGGLAGGYSVDIYGRTFDSNGNALTNEFLVNGSLSVCANPSVAVATDNSFAIAWSQKDTVVTNNSWDVYARTFNSGGIGGSIFTVNSQRYGDQYAPKIASLGTDYLIVWTSMGQDGSHEGVFGQFIHEYSVRIGGEFRVNTTVLNSQKFQAVASDTAGRALVVWSTYTGLANSMDLAAQRYANTLQLLSAPAAPVVSAVDSYTLSVTWAPISGFDVAYWDLFVDGSSTAIPVTNIYWVDDTYNPGETHSFQLAYVLTDGRSSPLSAAASAKTWGQDRVPHSDGLPDDWETLYFGTNTANWPKQGYATVYTAGGMSATALQIFEWGANPNDPSTWLRTTIGQTSEGWFLNWNPRPGYVYQVQTSTDLSTWNNLGAPRFASGTTDSVYLGLGLHGYYRVMRLIY